MPNQTQSNLQIPVEILVQQLQHIPGIRVYVDCPERQSGFNFHTTFEEFSLFWLQTYKRGIVKDNTYRSTYEEPVTLHLIPYFGHQPLTSISSANIQLYFKTLIDVLALETQKKLRNALRLIYEAAIENHICYESPVLRSLKLVSNISPLKKHVWTDAQYTIAYQFALTHPNGLDIITLLETAMSRSELLGLQPENHDYANSCLHLENGLVEQRSTVSGQYELVHDGLKNRHRRRTIPISPLLNELLYLKPKSIYVGGNRKLGTMPHRVTPRYTFHSPRGEAYNPLNWYRRVEKRFMRDLHAEHPEVPILTTHELRHSRATLLKNTGCDLFSIARLLGHCDLNMLAQRYAHDDLEALRRGLGLSREIQHLT